MQQISALIGCNVWIVRRGMVQVSISRGISHCLGASSYYLCYRLCISRAVKVGMLIAFSGPAKTEKLLIRS